MSGGEDAPVFGQMSWSPANNHLILTSSTGRNPTTTVSVVVQNASALGGTWYAKAKTNKTPWRHSDWIEINTDSNTIELPITLGFNEVPHYGQNESFTMYTQLKQQLGGNSWGQVYVNPNSLSCQITNTHDSTPPEHVNAGWISESLFTLPAGSGGDTVVTGQLFWDVKDLETGITSVSASIDVGNIVAIDTISLGNGATRYKYQVRINGNHASSHGTQSGSHTNVSATFTATNSQGMSSVGTTLYGSISISDQAAPSITITQNAHRTFNRYTSDSSHNNNNGYNLRFSVSDTHSSISSVSVVGNNSDANYILTHNYQGDVHAGLIDLGGGNYRQPIMVPANNAPLGGSVSYTFTIIATNSDNHTAYATATFLLNRFDDSAPTASITGGTEDMIIYTSQGSKQLIMRTLSFTWSDHSDIDYDSIYVEKVDGGGTGVSHPNLLGGTWDGNTYNQVIRQNQLAIPLGHTGTAIYRARVRDIYGNEGISSNLTFNISHVDDGPGITIHNISLHTFYSSSSETTQTGYVWWSVSAEIENASALKIGSDNYIDSVGSTNTTSENGAQYKTPYVIVRSVNNYGSSFTHISDLIELRAEVEQGVFVVKNPVLKLRYIDNTNPYFIAPDAKYHTFNTSQGNSATANMTVSVPVRDDHSGIASGTVVKKSGSNNWNSPTNVSLSNGNLNFTIPLSASVLSPDSNNVSQTVTMTITDNKGNSVSEDWTGYVRRVDNIGPSISGPSSITDYNFSTTGSSHISRDVEFTVDDLHNSIDTNSFVIDIEPDTGITTSGVSNVSGNTYKYTVNVLRSDKSITTVTTVFGKTTLTVKDNYDNSSSLETTHSGTFIDTSKPSINNAQMSGRFDFTTSSFSTTSITRDLTFTCSDDHSNLNLATVTTNVPPSQVEIGTLVRGDNNNYTVPITLTRSGLLTDNHGASVEINVTDSAEIPAIPEIVTLAGSYIDDTGPVFGTTSIIGGSEVNFLLSNATNSTISRLVTIPVSDEIQLNTFSVEILNSAQCSVSGLNTISSNNAVLEFTVTFNKNDYDLESLQTESVRVTAFDTSNRSNFTDVSFTVRCVDDVSPTISSASTIDVDFVESNSEASKTVTHSFSVADSGVGPDTPTVLGALAGSVTQAGGLNYNVPITVQRSTFDHYDGYKTVGIITISVNDLAGNPTSQQVEVRAQLTDDVAPSLQLQSPTTNNLNLTLKTTSDDNERDFLISVSDTNDINSDSLEVSRVSGSGTVSNASYNDGDILFKVTTRPSDYTADNSSNNEEFKITIADVNGNSTDLSVSYNVRVADATPPVLTLVEGPSFTLNEDGDATSSSRIVIRAIDDHTGINSNTFTFTGQTAADNDRLENTTTTQFNQIGTTNEWEFNVEVNNTGIVGTETIHGVVSVQDNAGNESEIAVAINIEIIDTVAPVISDVNYLTNVNVFSSNDREQPVNVTFTVTDTTETIPADNVTVTKKINTGETELGSVAQATEVQSVSVSGTTYTLPISVKASALGHNQTETLSYEIVAQDSVGNQSDVTSISFTVKVIDDVNPVVTTTESIQDFTLNNTFHSVLSVIATFSISDDITPADSLILSATSGWTIARNGGNVTVSKEITYDSGLIGSQTVTLTATDAAGNSNSASDTFIVSREDLTEPQFNNVAVSSNCGTITKLSQNTQGGSADVTISGNVTDTGSGIDATSLKIVSSKGTIPELLPLTSFDPSTGDFTHVFTWNYYDTRWNDLWSSGDSDVVFTEEFFIVAKDNEGNTKTYSPLHAKLIREDVIAPSLSISSVKVNGLDVSSFNPIDLTDRVNGDDDSGFTESIEIKMLSADNQSGLNHNSWSLNLKEDSDNGSGLTFSTANGVYNESETSPIGLTVTNDPGEAEGGYRINMRFHAPGFTESLSSQYGNSNFTLTLSVSDQTGNTKIDTAPIVINRIDDIPPIIGALQARSGSLNNITVSQSSSEYTHQIKVAASDSESGIASVVMNNNYSADGTGTENGTLFYYFKRTYIWSDIWDNKNSPSQLVLSGVKATATDNQGNFTNSASHNITVEAIDTVAPNIVSASVTNTQINLNTADTNSSVRNYMNVTIQDDEHRRVVVIAKKGGIEKLLISNSGEQYERVYSTFIDYEADNFALGNTIENWAIEVTDSAGNKSTSSFPEITITKEDGTSPIISSVQMQLANLDITSLSLNIASSDSVIINAVVTVNDAHSIISSVHVDSVVDHSDNAVPVIIGATTGNGPFTIPLTFDPSAVGFHANLNDFLIKISVVATDSAGNNSNYVKSLPIFINDNSPPTISNVTANNVVLNHDHNGLSDPLDEYIQLEADVADVGSGLSNVEAKVTFDTGVIHQTNQVLSLLSSKEGHYIWQKTVSAGQLRVNASPTDYSFEITATPLVGTATTESKTASAQLVDNLAPRCSIVTKKIDNTVLTDNSNITIQTEVGEVKLKYILTAVERSVPIVLTGVLLNDSYVSYTTESITNNSVTILVNYTAAMVLDLTEDNYNEYAAMTVSMIVEDQHDNQAQVVASTINMEVNDNTDPIVVTQTALSPFTINVSETSGTKTVTVTASFRDNEEGINSAYTNIFDENGSSLQAGIVQSLDTVLSNGGNDATVTAVLSYNYETEGIQYGENNRSVKIRVGDLNNNFILSDVIAFVVNRVDAVPPTLEDVEVRINGNLTQTANVSDNIQTAELVISAIVGDNRAEPVPLLSKNSAIGIEATSINLGHGKTYGGLYSWHFTIDEDNYSFGTHEDTYSISITDSDGLSAPTISKTVTVIKTDVIPPTIILQSVEAIALDANGNEGQSLLSDGDDNLITLYTNPNGSQTQPHRARLKITAQISDEGGLKAGFPAISDDITGWSLLTGTPAGTYVWQKDVSSVTPIAYQINTTVNALDTSNNPGTPQTATFNINTIDNTKPLISEFVMSGIVEVDGIPTIILRESTLRADNNITQDATIKLKWSDNGTTNTPVVTINYGSSTIRSETLTASVTTSGENIYYKSFGYEDFTSILPVGQTIPVTITATVTDTANNVRSQSLTADLQLIDDTVPLIKTYNLTGGTSNVNREELTFNNNNTYQFTSTGKRDGNGQLFLEANVTAEDLRGIASISVSSSPELEWVEQSTGIFHADIDYDDLGQYSTSYPYTITTVVTDNSGQSSSANKTIAFSKIDDINPVATLKSITGLTDDGKALMKSSDASDKTLTVEINVDENTVGTMGAAQLVGLGSGLDIQLTGTIHLVGSTIRVYSYDVTLARSDYKFVNLSDNVDDETINSNRIATEELSFSISDAQGNSSGVTQIISIPVELEDDIAPTGSISSDADTDIKGGVNKVNLTIKSAQEGHKIYVYAEFFESETGINPNTIGITGGSVGLIFSKVSNRPANKPIFTANVTNTFYSNLTTYDEYEDKTFTVTGRDNAGNLLSMSIIIGFKRSDELPPVIGDFLLSDETIIHLDEHTTVDEKRIQVILFAAVSDERGLSDQYVTYTKNDVEQNVRLPSGNFAGPWSQVTFESVKPDPFDPNASDDEYVFTLHCVDLNNQESTADATLNVEYDDINNPIIHNAKFYQDNAVITQKYISTNGHASQYGISETVQFKAQLSDLGDNINQLTVALNENGELSNSAISNITRVHNEDDYAVFNVTLTTNNEWSSSLQSITVVLTVDDRRGNSVNVNRTLDIAIVDESPPVIQSLSLQCFGQNGNNLVADNNANHKVGDVRGEMIAYDESGLDINSASLVTSDGRAFTYSGNQSAGTIDGRNATKIIFNLAVNYDDPMLDLGENTLTATANINDTTGNAATSVTDSCPINKLDQLAPQILGLAFVEDNVTSVKDGAWSTHKIQGTGNANMQGQKSLSSWIIIDTTIPDCTIPTSTGNQVLLSIGGKEDEHTLIMAINNHKFIVHAGLNKNEAVRNKSAVMSWDMRDDANTNPLHQFKGSTDSVELALLVRLDIGVIMLYANGRLIAAEQARERSFVAYGGSTPTLSVGDADEDANNRSVHANISGAWQGTISAFNIYDWSSGGSNKVAHESSVVVANVSTSKTTANGKVVFANLDNEETTLSFTENNVNSIDEVSTFANISTFNKNIDYGERLGNYNQDIPYVVSSAQVFDNSYSDSESLTIKKVNTDEELPVINNFVITHERAPGGSTIINASEDIVTLGSSSTETLLITINATDNADSGVADTQSFSITVGNTTLSTTKLAGSGLEHRVVLDWETLNGISGPGHGDYTLAISATVVDHASNESLVRNENLTIRAVDEEPPVITGAVFNTAGLVKTGKLESDDLVINVSVSNASPSAEVDMTVKFTDNSHYLTGTAISVSSIGSVYPSGPGVWTGSNNLPRGFTVTSTNALNGVYEATMKRTFAYSELSSKGSHQYKTGDNYENWTVTVTDGNNQTHSKNFTIKVNVVDDVNPTVPSISLNTDDIELHPGDDPVTVVATITAGDNYGILESHVELLSDVINGNNDIAVLVSNANILDVTPVNPSPANKKVFTASFTVTYDHISGTHSIAKEYKIGAKITDLASNESLIRDGARLTMTRKDEEAPQIVYTKQYDNSADYNTYHAVLLNSAIYNVVPISTAASEPDLRFTITDNDAVNPATIKMYQSQPIEANSTNPVLTATGGVYLGATEIAMNFDSGVYKPATPVRFNPDDFEKFHRNGEGHSYYVWVRVQAEDMAQNKTELDIPFKVNKLDVADPTALVSVNTTQRNGATEVNGVSSGFTTHSANAEVTANLRSDSTHAVVQVRVVASDNDNVKRVGTASIGTTIVDLATGPVVIDGVPTYTIERVYPFIGHNYLGTRSVEDFNVIIEDETGNTRAHRIPVFVNDQDVIAPAISVTMSTEGNNNSTELKYPIDSLTIVVRAEITDAGSGINVSTVQLTNASGYSSLGLVDGKYEWRKTVTWSNLEQLPRNITESISIKAKDNDDNERIISSSLEYSMTDNLFMTLVSGSTHLEEDGAYSLIMDEVKSINPAQIYNVKFVWEVNDPNDLLDPINSDVVITGDGAPTLVSVSKYGTAGRQTYTAIIALDTNNLNKGENSSISLALTTRDPYTQTRSYTLTQKFYVWDYETIDQVNDYYIMYAANINNSITKLKNSEDEITGYKMNERSTAFTNVTAIQVNYPTGQLELVEAAPFELVQYAPGSDVGSVVGSFKVEANVFADSNGTVDSEVVLEDKTVTISYIDDYTLAQIMYSNMDTGDLNSVPTINVTSPDHLTRTYGSEYLMGNPVTRAAISARVYDQGLQASSAPSVGIVDLYEITSQLDQIAQRNGTFGQNHIMQEGDLLVLTGESIYERNVTDIHGVQKTLVAATPIKLILKQTASARTI